MCMHGYSALKKIINVSVDIVSVYLLIKLTYDRT